MTIKIGKINASFQEAIKLLKKVELLHSLNYSRKETMNFSKFSEKFVSCMMEDDYIKIYKTAMKYGDYDILLNDNSFFQFSADNKCEIIRYAFYQVPFKGATIEDFAKFLGKGRLDSKQLRELESEQELDYELFKESAEERHFVTPIRYDYCPKQHENSIYHPTAHIHIGLEQNLRVPVRRELTPLLFTAFVVRMMYYKNFKLNIGNREIEKLMTRREEFKIEDPEFKEEEQKQLYLL
ncbi:DUF2290 domain-containing protein [Liquorilactobacillus uvarum]|uniref:DUF2290 domain-containing protein n=1 Tax=Liquorilactobacillus uvarum DSM 19971 TaxID=1423812 RepID=A0A0R1QBW2_9LACO|nr:DUF2290 domain-containing protein [Liquorilactobacillus uvarum]KRL38360.1 hypothetical protein FD20_GL001981 [Liquorilactobacillus uvarum DSM 19971]